MKKQLLLCLSLILAFSAEAIVPRRVVVPDIEGYVTLKGDLHLHTIFSDGNVWPTTRVEEAAIEGLDIIAITEHMDDRLQKMENSGMFVCDRNDPYEIASKAGKSYGVMVIHGGEVTRAMPPGHFNTLFIKDCEAVAAATEANAHKNEEAMRHGLREADAQGGFCVWNHPHWERQALNETVWYPIHTELYNEGLLDGIEIYNSCCGYSIEAHRWAMEKNLTLISGTDSHNLVASLVDFAAGELRPMTLIFAKERSINSVKEALENRMTAVFADRNVYGRENVLRPLFNAMIEISNIKYSAKAVSFSIVNNSSIPVVLEKAEGSEGITMPRLLVLEPFEQRRVTLYGHYYKDDIAVDEFDMNYNVTNFHVDAGVPMKFSMHFTMPKKK